MPELREPILKTICIHYIDVHIKNAFQRVRLLMNRFWLRMPPETKQPWLPIDAHKDQGIECLTSEARTKEDR